MSEEERALPPGWATALLEDVCDVLDHRRVPVNSDARANRAGPYPYYGANGPAGTIDDFLFEGPHVLLAEDGGYFDEPGRAVAYEADGKFWVNNHAHILRMREEMPGTLLVHQLNQMQWGAFVSGTTRLKLTQASMRRVPVRVPPLAEQRRIVAKLDDLLARSRRAKEALAEIPALLERYRQSVLTAAFRGELTADWQATHRDADPSTDATHGGATSHASEYPHDDAWPVFRLDQLVEEDTVITYGIVLPGEEVKNGVPYVRQQDIFDGRIDAENLRHTSREVADKHTRSSLRESDVLLCIIRHLRVAIVPAGLDGANITQGTVRIRCNRCLVEPRYVALFLQGPQAQSWMKARYFGMAMPRINVADARAIPVPVPSLEEQLEVVRRVEGALATVDGLRDHATAIDVSSDAFERSLLTRAFRGELVPQDPADEPASVLLDRLRAERAATDAPRKKAGRPAKRGR